MALNYIYKNVIEMGMIMNIFRIGKCIRISLGLI